MRARLISWLLKIIEHPYVTGIVVLSVLVFTLFIFLAYRFGWDWTGFNSGTSQITITSTSKGNYIATIPQSSKSLWDWLQLLGVLAIPVVVGLGAAWYTAQQGKVSDRENTDNQRERALQTYIDKMSELLLYKDKPLLKSQQGDEVRTIARVRTITILSQLDARRINYVFSFLVEVGLMSNTSNGSLVSLEHADLRSVQWERANLYKADLSLANLSYANLYKAILRGAHLIEADLDYADLRGAHLINANLTNATLKHADLRGADLSDAILKDVRGITAEELEKQAKSLKGATMPDGSIHP
jgi:hypothetical protein